MASLHMSSLPSISTPIRSRHSPNHASTSLVIEPRRRSRRSSCLRRCSSSMTCKSMVQQTVGGAGAAATYAKDMERLSAKESLLLAFRDAGGFEALVTGKTTAVQRIDVNERITALERLNPTPRPTTSPFLEGLWNFEWFGSGTPGLFAARFFFQNFPPNLANLTKMDVVIKDANAKITVQMRLLYSVESKFTVYSSLTVEGPVRMKEEYLEGVLETPTVIEAAVPEQLKGLLGQAASTVQQLPDPIKNTISSGLRVPLTGTFHRLFMISYLDDEILIIRDTAGVPEVLTRLDAPASPLAESSIEYVS